jgi:hypothetical protein
MAMAIGMNTFCMVEVEDHPRDQPKQQGDILNSTGMYSIHSHIAHTIIHAPRICGHTQHTAHTERTATASLGVLVLVRAKIIGFLNSCDGQHGQHGHGMIILNDAANFKIRLPLGD